jgi:hypothetical protein
MAIEVHQVVRDMEGKLPSTSCVFRIEAGLVTRFDIENAGGLSIISHACRGARTAAAGWPGSATG